MCIFDGYVYGVTPLVCAALAVVKLGIRSLIEGSCTCTCLGVYHRYKESFLYIDGVYMCICFN